MEYYLFTAGNPYQLLLSTASPNPGVSTIVSSSWTPPSFIKTLDCSTWNRRKNDVCIVFTTNCAFKTELRINNKDKNTDVKSLSSHISHRKHLKLAACSNTPSPTVLLPNYAEKPKKHTSIWKSGARQLKFCSEGSKHSSGNEGIQR